MNEEDESGWEPLETHKGPEQQSRVPRWLGFIFHYFMILLCFTIAFCIGGFILFAIVYDRRIGGARYAMNETIEDAWARFIIGGVIGIATLIYWRFRRQS